jgi:hypothetical protein
MFDNMEAVLPLTPRNGEVFAQKIVEFGQWISTLPTDTPLELHVTVAPFDTTARAWSYRRFTDDEQQTMMPCHRLIVGCTDMWGDEVQEIEYAICQPTQQDDEDFSWGGGIAAVLSSYPELAVACQSSYLDKMYRKHGFDTDEFLSETKNKLSAEATFDIMESLLYVCEMEDMIAKLSVTEADTFPQQLFQLVANEVRTHLETTMKNLIDMARGAE